MISLHMAATLHRYNLIATAKVLCAVCEVVDLLEVANWGLVKLYASVIKHDIT